MILLVVGLASVFAYGSNTLGTFDHLAKALVGTGTSEIVVLLGITLLLLIAGMFLDAISIYFIFLPLLVPIAIHVRAGDAVTGGLRVVHPQKRITFTRISTSIARTADPFCAFQVT